MKWLIRRPRDAMKKNMDSGVIQVMIVSGGQGNIFIKKTGKKLDNEIFFYLYCNTFYLHILLWKR